MTTVTDDALDWYQERSIGDTNGPIDTVALGTGTGSEGNTSDGLDSPEYSGEVDSSNNVELISTATTGRMEAIITVKGGTEVPPDTDITEMAVYASQDNVVIAVDEFSAVTVEGGHTEEFTMPIQIQR